MSEKILVHQHLIVRAEVENPTMDKDHAVRWLDVLVTKIGMKKVTGPHVGYVEKEGNKGITGVVIIETSHIAIHIWDEISPALVQLDVYTCSTLDLNVVFEHLKEMNPVKIEYKFIDREHGLDEIQCTKRLL